VVIAGNHEYVQPCEEVKSNRHTAEEVLDASFIISKLSNAIVLHHSSIVLKGIHIYGSPWVPWHAGACPENGDSSNPGRRKCWQAFKATQSAEIDTPCPTHRFHEIPHGVDVLLTHGPSRDILDCLEGSSSPWGSSSILHAAIVATRPKVHLFGHLHEQRGCWWREDGSDGDGDGGGGRYQGGAEYTLPEGTKVHTHRPPVDYPCQVISNNAMLNHSKWEQTERRIAGPARVIVATRQLPVAHVNDDDGGDGMSHSWNFHVHRPFPTIYY
jgi:hypothetical protein